VAQLSVRPNSRVPYEIRYADDALIVVDKPAGVVTQPGKKHERDSLLNGLFAEFGPALQNLGESRDWGLLHRLDRDTSGLVLVALRKSAFDHLLEQFKKRLVQKIYWAIVAGVPRPAQGVLQQPIAEVVGARKKAVLARDGKPAITAYRIIQSAADVSLIEARPKTGRLHQIRVHMASIGCPVLGEDTYAGKTTLPNVPRLCLHAASLSFLHPVDGHRKTVTSSWPQGLAATLKRFSLTAPQC
jgi:23S rRNA pseudouridine1911/1915/1917 synthase